MYRLFFQIYQGVVNELACVAGVQKIRRGEFKCETAREGEGALLARPESASPSRSLSNARHADYE